MNSEVNTEEGRVKFSMKALIQTLYHNLLVYSIKIRRQFQQTSSTHL